MTMATDGRRRLSVDKEVKDLDVGYRVIEVGGARRKAWIESIDGDAITVIWDGDSTHNVVTPAMIRKIPLGGHALDARHK